MFKKKGESKPVIKSENVKGGILKRMGSIPLTVVSVVALLGSLSFYSLYNIEVTSKSEKLLTLSEIKDSVASIEKNTILAKSGNAQSFKDLEKDIQNVNSKLAQIQNKDIQLNQTVAVWNKSQPVFKGILAEKTKTEEIKKDVISLTGKTKILMDSVKSVQSKNESGIAVNYIKEISSLSEKITKDLEGVMVNNSLSVEKAYFLSQNITILNSLLTTFKGSIDPASDVNSVKALDDLIQVFKPYGDFSAKLSNQLSAKNLDISFKEVTAEIEKKSSEIKEQSAEQLEFIAIGLLVLSLASIVLLFLNVKNKENNVRKLKAEIAQLEKNKGTIESLVDLLTEVSKGNLQSDISITDKDYAALVSKINEVGESFASLLNNVANISSKVDLVSESTEATSKKLLGVASIQHDDLGKSMEKIGQITNDIDELAQITWIAKEDSNTSQKASMEGSSLVKQSIEKMDEIRNTIQESSKKIKKLGESAQAITEVTGLIQGITKQINVLALNAAIQAASSGESGREFTVVAQEVQRLAKDSEDATKKIEKLISDIQGDTASAIASMEKTTQEVVSGAKLTDSAGKALRQIDDLSKSVAERISEAANKLEEKSTEMVTVANDMRNLQKVSEQVGDIIKVASDQVDSLKDISKQLNGYVSLFNKK